MSEYEQVIDEIVKHGVVVKVDKIVDDNYLTSERRYVGCVVKLDFSEHDKVFENKIAELEKRIQELDTIDAIRIDEKRELKQRIAELESKGKNELPFDPLDTANYLINATYERETNGIERAFQNLPEKVNSDRYTVDELEQIAEHLLIYCRHNKE